LYNGGCPTVLLPLPTFFVAAIVLLDQHRGSSTLLEFFLLIITSEFALDKNGSLRHLFIKCILQEKRREAEAFQEKQEEAGSYSERLVPLRHDEKQMSLSLSDWELYEKRVTANWNSCEIRCRS